MPRVSWRRFFVVLVGPVPASSFVDVVFPGSFGDQFIEVRLFSRSTPQDASEALHVLSHATTPGDHDGHVGFRDVHTFIEHFRGHQNRIDSFAEGLQEIFPFFHLRMVGEDGKKKEIADAIGHFVVVGENNDAVSAMLLNQLPDFFDFCRRSLAQLFLGTVGFESLASLRSATCSPEELAPAIGLAENDPFLLQEIGVYFAGDFIFYPFLPAHFHPHGDNLVRSQSLSFQFMDVRPGSTRDRRACTTMKYAPRRLREWRSNRVEKERWY